MAKVQLRHLAHARSGDKGDASDISLFALDAGKYEVLKRVVTAERYEVDNVQALKFIVHGALNGGASRSLRSDNLGKTFASALLRLEIEVD